MHSIANIQPLNVLYMFICTSIYVYLDHRLGKMLCEVQIDDDVENLSAAPTVTVTCAGG